MTQKNYSKQNCPISLSLSVLGGQWTLLIARNLINGINRFEGLQKNLNISRNLLTQRLREMEQYGLTKRVVPEGYRRAIYEPTKKCYDLTNTLLALSEWSEKWMPDPLGPRIKVKRKKNGKALRLALVPTDQAEKIAEEDFEIKFGSALG